MTVAVAAEARARVDRIKVGVDAVWHLIVESYQARDWLALGYATWDEMCTREFGTSRLRLPREERAETVQSLRDAGLSLRAIEVATGASVRTIRRELSGGANATPEPEPEPVYQPSGMDEFTVNRETGEVVEDEPLTDAECEAIEEARTERKITGLDGRQYAATKPNLTPPKPRRKPYLEELAAAIHALSQSADRVIELFQDDRYRPNADQATAQNRDDLTRILDSLHGVAERLA